VKRLAVILALAALCCGFIGAPGTNPNPLTFWWYSGDGTVLRPALECALERIRAASCLPVDVSFDAAHWVSQRPPETMGGRMGWTTGTSWYATRIKIVSTADADLTCRLLIHELSHVLRRSNAHVGETGDGSTKLLEPNLAAICTVQPCGCFNPEGP
jgi:hypothetical protein